MTPSSIAPRLARFLRCQLLLAPLLLTAACGTAPVADAPSDATAPAEVAPPTASAPPAVRTPEPSAMSAPAALRRPAVSRSLSPATVNLPLQTITSNVTPSLIDLTIPPDNLWQRIRQGFGMPDLHDPLVVDRQSWYLNRPEMLRRIFERGRRYLYHIVDELEKRGMPTELALLPMVESAFNPQAVSSARAMGIWQFIPSTGKNYKLDQNWWVDERRDIIASTDAALNYLQNIYEMHGDWHLALASYNWGEYAVARAIAKNQAKGLLTDYASLTMPAETRYYVPKLQALKNIVAHPEFYDFALEPISNQPYFETILKPERIDVAVAARLAEIPLDEFVSLNPAYHRPVIQGDQAGPLVLPADKVDTFLANLARYENEDRPLSNWLTYKMGTGETLARIAERHRISETQLRQINGITPRIKVGTGFTLLVPRPGSLPNAESIARALPKEAPPRPVPEAKGAGKPAKTAHSSASRPAARSDTKKSAASKPVVSKSKPATPKSAASKPAASKSAPKKAPSATSKKPSDPKKK